MSKANAAIRQARHALHFLISGVLRDAETGVYEDENENFTTLFFNNLIDEMEDWEVDRFLEDTKLVQELQARASEPAIAEVLTKFNLMP